MYYKVASNNVFVRRAIFDFDNELDNIDVIVLFSKIIHQMYKKEVKMGININDLNRASSLLENESIVNKIRELSSEELKITGGTYGFGYYPFFYYSPVSTPSTPSRNSDDVNININLNNEIDNEANSESNRGLRPAISY